MRASRRGYIVPRSRDLPCADCGTLMWRRKGMTLPAGQARCQPCRRARPTVPTLKALTCGWCGEEFFRPRDRYRYCSIVCFARADGARRRLLHDHVPTSRDSRAARDSAAPGLSRTKLLARWRARHTLCAYCRVMPADTVDHVVPLILGGTNFEGNLVPACRRCNSSKADRLLVEWGRS